MASEETKFDPKEMPFLDHLEELRWRIMKALGAVVLFTCIAFPFTGVLLDLLTLPNDHLASPAKLIFLKPTGMLVVRLEVALIVGVIVSLPVIFYQLWMFIAPGLLENERKYVVPFVLYTTGCFLVGTGFAYFILIPTVLPFLFSMGTETIEATINITEYMSFILRLILVAGLVFELPMLSFILARIGLLTASFMRKYRRYSIVLFFIFAAIVTPPDPMSQLLIAIPLVVLYEASIFIALLGQKLKRQTDESKESD